ncbi:hypothetical protein UlMin_033918 [Ulmus minor]
MISATPSTNPNPKNSKNVYHIGGIQVEFPYRPYGSQLAFMGRVISTLDRAQKEGHCHALLESPTGTGKSLSLLCSTIAWQQNFKLKNLYAKLSYSKPDPEATTDPLGHGGGFVPEDEPSSVAAPESSGPAESTANNKSTKKKATPTIYYASRTHSQISQVIREYRKTGYRVPMAVLASRKHYCTNPYVRGKDNVDEECKLLLSNREVGCPEFKNLSKVKSHPSLQKGGCHEAHDIEDLVKVGQVVKGCSYYAARSMADDAELVFCPYNYIINPVIRGAMEVDIKGAIIVLDEAHNIEDITRDAGSVDVEEEVLLKLQGELELLRPLDALVYQPLYEMMQDLISWIGQKKNTLEKREFQHFVSCWTGDKALRELEEANVSRLSFPVLLECATKAIKAASDAESELGHLSGMSVMTLEGLFSALTYFFSRNGCHMHDYQLALQKYIKRDAGKTSGEWTHTLSLWCLNPAAVFRDIADLSLSVILTSGTLSPLNSFSSELGLQFGTSLEAPHVIDIESQVWSAIMSTGPSNFPLNASYKTADAYAFQDALGKSLEDIFKVVPGGCLVFFPSYKLLDKLCKRWRETGQWSKLRAIKSLFVEPRGGSQDDFDSVLKDFYESTNCVKPASGRSKRSKKIGSNHLSTIQSATHANLGGAGFLAVCRGKVSEGIDFSDDNARVVIIVGIPFPNINDIQVALKKKYNDAYKSSKNLLSGNEWYCHQAFRALNQAAGRCIRHRFDYGAIIFLDERYREERNRAYVSKWLRKSIRQYNSFESTLEGLKSFFSDVKERVDKNMVNVSQISDTNEETVISTVQNKGFRKKKDLITNKSDHCGLKDIPMTKYNASSLQKSQDDVEAQASARINESRNCIEIIDLEYSPQKDSRYPSALSMADSLEDPEVSIVKETPCLDFSIAIGSPMSLSKDVNSASTIIEASSGFLDQISCPVPVADHNRTPNSQCLISDTLRKNVAMSTTSSMLEMESSLNWSVNSHCQKRRKSIFPPFIKLLQQQDGAVDTNASDCTSYSMANGDANRKIEFSVETEEKSKLNTTLSPTNNNSVVTTGPVMDKRLQVFCSLCKNPLGLPENHQYVTCYLTTSSKADLESLHQRILKPQKVSTSKGISFLVTDISSVDQRLLNRTIEGDTEQGKWCQKDGCVYNTIFCPFCISPKNCLGAQVLATNASNVHLLEKILFYMDQLETKIPEVSIDNATTDEALSPANGSSMDRVAIHNPFDRFSYTPPDNAAGGWRTTKSKLKLPKRG